MKRLICEMCGSADLLKDGGIFVCQACGCKYTVEEARKMMDEGTVDIRRNIQNRTYMRHLLRPQKFLCKRQTMTV